MAISLEFIDFIIPIDIIRLKYPGGWEKCLHDHKALIGGRVWFDAYLLRDGAMNPMDIESLVEEWSLMGFEPYCASSGTRKWKDFCVVESMFGGVTLPCSWITVIPEKRIANLSGTEAGKTCGRAEFSGYDGIQ
jgi:hypothetical protein